jgi:hypothetical protein
MKKVLLAAVVVLGLAAIPGFATAATITSSGSTIHTASLSPGSGSATFTTAGLITITCTTHTVRLVTTDLRSTAGGSTNTSWLLRAANNTYSSSAPEPNAPLCTYTALGASGAARVDIRCDWLLTAIDTRTGTITLPVDPCVTITFTTGANRGCVISVGRQSVNVAITSLANPTRVKVIATNAPVRFTTVGCPIGAGTANQTETLSVQTLGISVP